MILADKIILLRKKKGWSQENFAARMSVSRQAVSKWESAQAVPEIEKIILMSEIFGVTTDYLLKDGAEIEELVNGDCESTVRRISAEEAKLYLLQRKKASWIIAIATFLCIISPITLIVLGAASEIPSLGISQTLMGTVGISVMFFLIACAVSLFIYSAFKNEPYEFLDKNEPFTLEHGVFEFISEKKKKFRSAYAGCNILATSICIFSPLPLIVSAFFEREMLLISMLVLLMLLVGVASSIFIVVGVREASMDKLLLEGDYTETKKKRSPLKEAVGFSFWGILTFVFLLWSYFFDSWRVSWIIFGGGAILFPIIMRVCDYISDRKNGDI